MPELRSPMADQIVAHPNTVRQAATTIRQALAEESDPITREYTLFYSGVTYGVEVMQQYMMDMSRASVGTLRALLGLVDQTTPMIDDLGTLEKFTALRSDVAGMLDQRTKDVRDAYVAEMGQMFALDAKWITETKPLSMFSDDEMAMVGHKAYRATPPVFFGWSIAARTDKLERMVCKCPRCLVGMIGASPVMEWQEIEEAVKFHGGFVQTFRAYAEHMIGDIRVKIERDMEEIQSVHIEEKGHGDLLNDILHGRKASPDAT